MKLYQLLLILFLFLLTPNFVFSQKEITSFEQQNKNTDYYSFSFGMGACYGNNSSLVRYVGYELPFYNNLSDADKLSDFSSGFEVFGGAEIQIRKSLSIKVEYSYFSKSFNLTQYLNYDFNYEVHQPYVMAMHIISQKNSFIKFGAGIGFLFANFTRKAFAETNYKSFGIGLKLNGILDIQISKNFAGYIEVFINKTFQGDLKDESGNKLISKNNETVNLSTLGVGIRLGAEFIFF